MSPEKAKFESLWAPWRVEYFEREKDPDFLEHAANGSDDAETLVVCRRKMAFLIMNRYPYTAGHLMAAPYRKVAELEALNNEERLELLNLGIYAKRLLTEAVYAQGFNMGWNLGAAAGAGVEEHLHLHIVPRWNGDHNFMTTIGGARIIPEGLKPLYTRLCEIVQRISFEEAVS